MVGQNSIAIEVKNTPVFGRLTLPPSKSETNRALHLASLADGVSTLHGVLRAEDSFLMEAAWQSLGAEMHWEGEVLRVQGTGGKLAAPASIEVGNAGTVARFLLPILSLSPQSIRLDGNPYMRQRPHHDLIAALRLHGANILEEGALGHLPLRVLPLESAFDVCSVPRGVRVGVGNSSQYLSALLMAAPYLGLVDIFIDEGKQELVSRPYVEMTLAMMADFGVQAFWEGALLRIPPGQRYQAREYHIEGDASSASYFFAMVAICGGELTVAGISRNSRQGDLQFLEVLIQMGCRVVWHDHAVTIQSTGQLTAVDINMRHFSDVVPTLAVTALFAKGKTTITDVYNLRIKECDRLHALSVELSKLGASIETTNDSISIEVKTPLKGCPMACYSDHRLAMAFALVGLKIPGISILEPDAVKKTYPNFFRDFYRIKDLVK